MLSVALYWCKTWSLTLTEHRLRVFKSRVIKIYLGLRRVEITGDWRKLHYKELLMIYTSVIIFQVI